MPAQSTENWSDQGSNMLWAGPGLPVTFIARRGWTVTGASTDDAARAATPLDGAARAIPTIGSRHSLDPRLICTELPVEPGDGPLIKIVRAIYTIPDGTLIDDDPLRAPPIIRTHIGTTSLPADTDIDGNTIVNSAFDPPDQPPLKSVAIVSVNIQVNAPLILAAKAVQYTDTVNSDNFEILSLGFLGPGQCYCAGFTTISGQRQGQAYVTVNVDLELADLITINGVATSFFDLRLPDIGYNAYGPSNRKGPITFKAGPDRGKRVPMPVSLNGRGAPLKSADYGIGEDAAAGLSGQTPNGATVINTGPSGQPNGTLLGYRMKRRRTFAGLL